MPSRRRAVDAVRTSFRLRRAQRAKARIDSPPPAGGLDSLTEQVRSLTKEVRVLETLARTDELTGLPNRRAWDEQLARELARAKRRAAPVCVAMLDLDRFKAFNDTYGHQLGDLLLVETAAAWGAELRNTDILCRWGGDEFAALLPDCPEHEADRVIARLVAATPRQQSCVSGVACWKHGETADELLARSDTALYESKRRESRLDTGAGRPRREDSRDGASLTFSERADLLVLRHCE
jgi:diguanylate cyclase (GGDEF)-like protein